MHTLSVLRLSVFKFMYLHCLWWLHTRLSIQELLCKRRSSSRVSTCFFPPPEKRERKRCMHRCLHEHWKWERKHRTGAYHKTTNLKKVKEYLICIRVCINLCVCFVFVSAIVFSCFSMWIVKKSYTNKLEFGYFYPVGNLCYFAQNKNILKQISWLNIKVGWWLVRQHCIFWHCQILFIFAKTIKKMNTFSVKTSA